MFNSGPPPCHYGAFEPLRPEVQKSRFPHKSLRFNADDKEEKALAGVVGFEPTVHATKKRCLTAWLHPISEAVNTPDATSVQARFCENLSFFQSSIIQKIFAGQFRTFCVDQMLQRVFLVGTNWGHCRGLFCGCFAA